MLVDSRRCIEHVWEAWATIHRCDARQILATAHGRRTSETLREIAPELDVAAEVARLDAMEQEETRGLNLMPGAAPLLASLPFDRWAVVTSGSPRVARFRLASTSIPIPAILITAADVARGKPAPDGYLQAAESLAIAAADCVVIEDAPVGVAAARAAGMRVIALGGTAAPDALREADYYLPHLGDLAATTDPDGTLRLTVGGV